MPGEQYRHIFLAGLAQTHGFTSPRQGGGAPRIPTNRDRALHSASLDQQLQRAWAAADQQQQRAAVHMERHGAYLEFQGEPGFDLAIQSLESLRSGIRLLNVRREGEGNLATIIATVYIPHAQRGYFLRKIQEYATLQVRDTATPRNAKLVNSISHIRHAVLESFWRPDERDQIPRDEPAWVEVWLSTDRDEPIETFEALVTTLQISFAVGVLKFPERSVKLLLANRQQLQELIEASDSIAECRPARELATFFIAMPNRAQAERVRTLLDRTTFNGDAVAICILDTGVNNGHDLIRPVLAVDDMHAVDPLWNTNDHDGHGTLMAGTAAYGDILALLNGNDPIEVDHKLESAKILPPPPAQNPRELWGYMTSQGISRAEIQAPGRKRIVCMAVTATETRDRGRPTSWSAAVDEIASGYSDDTRRLVVLSAGNVQDPANWRRYPDDNLSNEVHDPAQSWNALTVGAFTEKTVITDPAMRAYAAIAPARGLSPYSTTSTTWPTRKWPIKPEVVFEGGNVARGPNDSVINHEDLQLLSTHHEPNIAQFAAFNATSAATAQAAWMAARIQARYPDAWPETIRGLIVHTAQWPEEMIRQFLPAAPTRNDYARLLRICGYGVPNLERALYCASNSLTLISQAELQPYDRVRSRYVTRDMHLHNLPWPIDILGGLGETQVSMRVTLSYFVEPGPGEVGWDNRYRYASHALRFAVNGPGESEQEFLRRVNAQAREDGEHPGTEAPDNWVIGDARNVGSIHSDVWRGRATDLAASNRVGVYPAVGWWRERHHLNRWGRRTRYSLIISIQTPEQAQDIYIPVAQQIGVAVPIEVQVGRRQPRR